MGERDPFEPLRDLIDEPVAPRAAFADELRSRLMREMSASSASREEQAPAMDAAFAPRPPVAFPTESARRIRPMVILELAAVALVILGLVAALNRGWFQNDPDPATVVPAAALQGDETPTPERQPEQTPTPEVEGSAPSPDANDMTPTVSPDGSLEPTVEPPGNIPNTVWTLTLPEGESMDFGGMLVEDNTVYRLLATPSFVGIQAVDAETGTVTWQQAHRWAGHLFAIDDDVLYFDGGGNTLTAVDANSGAELWRASVSGNPMAITEDDDRVFVLLDNEMVSALDKKTGDELWVAQGSAPQAASGGSASDSASQLIAVEENVVAAISTSGVLSGFDVATGEEIWVHEGFEAATSSILTEDDRFIVIDGVGIWAGGVEIDEAGQVEIGTASSGDSGTVDCVGLFQGAGQSEATPVVSSDAPVSDSFIIQSIDPKTGDILWEEQTVPGGAVSTFTGASGAPIDATCAVELTTGNVISVTTESDLDDHLIIGSASGGVFVADDSDDVAAAMIAAVESVSGSSDATVIAAAVDDGNAFLQLADGTLVKVHVSDFDDDDDHHEDRDDDSDDGTPDSDSDDD